jgi:hypothetical protein
MDLVALRQIGHRRLLAQGLQHYLAFNDASIFRLVFCAMLRSV